MNAFNFLSNPVADALGWTLLHAVWQGFALVLPTAVVLHLLQHKSGLLRYRAGVLTLLTQLLVSISTFFWYYQPIVRTQPVTAVRLTHSAMPVQWQTIAQTLPWQQQTQHFLEAHLGQIVLVYLIGVALFGLRLAGGWLYLQRISKTAVQPATKACTQLTDQLRSALAIRAVVQVRESARIAVPMVVGVLKPILLLPVGLATYLSIREIEAVLAHELAHIKRHDYAVNLLQSVIDLLYFFHPALWWLSARVREEREHCCDDLAVQVCGGDGRVLAQALARVEELRLTQLEPTPALAMAFASKRQHLLHRVRRVLGMPTRPFVSNGSLAGLTLATILLMSVSVYAVQQQPETPKTQTKQPKPKSTQRFNGETSGKQIGYNLLDGRLTSIDIDGKRLPKAQVNQIQKQLDRVLTGQLNLDSVSQPNRDILLTIFEKSAGFEAGMAALSKGFDQIDYNNIVANAMKEVKGMNYDSLVTGAMQEVKDMNYQHVVDDAMAAVDTNIVGEGSVYNHDDPEAERQRAYHTQQMDSLSQLIAQRSQMMQTIYLQMETLQFPVEKLLREQEVLDWQKQKLMEQRNAFIERHQKLLYGNGKQKLSQADVEKQLAALEPNIKKTEEQIIDWNSQVDALKAKQEELKTPMEKMKREAEQLQNQIEKLSEQIERHGNRLGHLVPMPPMPPLSIRVNGHAPRPPRPARAPHPMVAPVPAPHPNIHVVPVKPAVPPRPKAVPIPKP